MWEIIAHVYPRFHLHPGSSLLQATWLHDANEKVSAMSPGFGLHAANEDGKASLEVDDMVRSFIWV